MGRLLHTGRERSQLSQNERGATIDISRGTRYATTVTKLPVTAPTANARAPPIPAGKSIPLLAQPSVLTTLTTTVRSRGPSHSASISPCHLPSRSLAPATGMLIEVLSIALRICACELPSLWRNPPLRGTSRSRWFNMSVVTSGSQFSDTITAQVVWGTNKLHRPCATRVSATAWFTASVMSTNAARAEVAIFNSTIASSLRPLCGRCHGSSNHPFFVNAQLTHVSQEPVHQARTHRKALLQRSRGCLQTRGLNLARTEHILSLGIGYAMIHRTHTDVVNRLK